MKGSVRAANLTLSGKRGASYEGAELDSAKWETAPHLIHELAHSP
jgi:hypothetical protein